MIRSETKTDIIDNAYFHIVTVTGDNESEVRLALLYLRHFAQKVGIIGETRLNGVLID